MLDDMPKLKHALNVLGARHVIRGVFKSDYPVFMEAVIKAFKDALRSTFTPQIERSWRLFVNLISTEMISDNFDIKLTEESIKDVQDTWATAKTLGYEAIGDKLF